MQELLAEAPSGDPLQHPDLVALVVDLRTAFPDSPAAALEQQALDLIAHVAPEQLAAVVAQYRAVLADPERLAQARDLERRFAALAEVAPAGARP